MIPSHACIYNRRVFDEKLHLWDIYELQLDSVEIQGWKLCESLRNQTAFYEKRRILLLLFVNWVLKLKENSHTHFLLQRKWEEMLGLCPHTKSPHLALVNAGSRNSWFRMDFSSSRSSENVLKVNKTFLKTYIKRTMVD